MTEQFVILADRKRDLEALNADFRVVVISDHPECEAEAFRVTWRLLANVVPGTRVDVRFWECGTMKRSSDWHDLHADLARASAIIVAACGQAPFRSAVLACERVSTAETKFGELMVAVFERALPFLRQPAAC